MKYCGGCDKKTNNFGKNKAKKDGLQTRCKECRKNYQKLWYRKNPILQRDRVLKTKGISKKKLQDVVYSLLAKSCCVDCGNKDIRVLEFDHIDPKSKYKSIAYLLSTVASKALLEIELKKCEIRCANCHRIKTANTRDWVRLQYITVATG